LIVCLFFSLSANDLINNHSALGSFFASKSLPLLELHNIQDLHISIKIEYYTEKDRLNTPDIEPFFNWLYRSFSNDCISSHSAASLEKLTITCVDPHCYTLDPSLSTWKSLDYLLFSSPRFHNLEKFTIRTALEFPTTEERLEQINTGWTGMGDKFAVGFERMFKDGRFKSEYRFKKDWLPDEFEYADGLEANLKISPQLGKRWQLRD
jgi:hypothetical protein